MTKRKDELRYRLFYVIGDADSVKAKAELRGAGVPILLDPFTRDQERAVLERDFMITKFPALFSNRACWQGLPAIRSFIKRWNKRK